MDYRAAATRQLKDTKQSNAIKASGSSGNGSSAQLNTPQSKPKGQALMQGRESSKMANASDNGRVPTTTSSAKPAISYAGALSSGSSPAAENGHGGRKGLGRLSPSAGNTVASAPSPVVPDIQLTSLININVRITLVNGEAIEGFVFTYDVYSGILALISDPATKMADAAATTTSKPSENLQVSLVAASNIKSVDVVPASAPNSTPSSSNQLKFPEIHKVPIASIEARKQRVLMAAQAKAERIGIGVSDEAQEIFEALSKTLPCQWSGDKIIVLDEVVIDPPYGAENCNALVPASFSLNRVKKVLQGEKSRITAQTTTTATK